MRPQHQSPWPWKGRENFIMICDNENTIDSYRWIFNNTGVYCSALTCYYHIKQAHPQWSQVCYNIKLLLGTKLGIHLCSLIPCRCCWKSPWRDSLCFDTIAIMYLLLSPWKICSKNAKVMKEKHLVMGTYFGFKIPKGLAINKENKIGIWEGKMHLQLPSYSHI